MHKIICYTKLHVYLLNLKEIGKLSLKMEENNYQGFNFIKLYTNIFKEI